MKKVIIFLCIILMLACSKNKNNKEQNENYTTIDVPIVEESFSIPNQVGNNNYLPLESVEINKISSISKILFFNKQIFIFDRQQNKILLFDQNGKYLSQIYNLGKGPNEYLTLTDFLVNKTDSCLELLDHGDRKTLKLDASKMVISKIKFSFFCDKFLKTEEGGYLCFTNNQTNKTGSDGQSFNFILTDKNGNILKNYFPITPENEELIISESQTFVPYQTGANFSLPVDNNIYFASKNGIKIKYKISFGHYTTPENILKPLKESNKANRSQLQMKLLNKVAHGDYAYAIHSILENNSFLFFQFRKGRNVHSVLYDKKTKNIKSGVTLAQNIDTELFGRPIALNDKDQLITVLFPYEFHDRLKTINHEKNDKIIANPIFEKYANSIHQFDNPILQFIHLSDF